MRLFGFRGRGQLVPLWEYTAGGQIWHVRIVNSDLILAEERDPVSKVVAYACLDLHDGKVVWRKEGFGEGWWIEIAGIFEGTLLLQGYSDPGLPIHRGIIAVDLHNGYKLWERADLALQGIIGENFAGRDPTMPNDACYELSHLTGATVGPCERSSTHDFPGLDEAIEFPLPLEEAAVKKPILVQQIARQFSGVEQSGPVSVLGRGNQVIFSVYEIQREDHSAETRYHHNLFFMSTETGKVLFKQTLDRNVTLFNPDPFFIFRDALYCIRERRTLMAVPIGAFHDSFPAQ